MKKSSAAEVLPTKPGTPFGGGLYCARLFDGTQAYALIVAGADIGPLTRAQATKKAKALREGGHKDWQLPTRAEALAMFEYLRPKVDGAEAAFQREWYWTSQQYESAPSSAWYQSFSLGFQLILLKSAQLRARAVRRLKI